MTRNALRDKIRCSDGHVVAVIGTTGYGQHGHTAANRWFAAAGPTGRRYRPGECGSAAMSAYVLAEPRLVSIKT